MKKNFPIFLLLASFIAIGQTPCLNGMAGDYPCNGYDLQSFIPFSTFDAESGNDSWGWTDPQDGTEYALMGLNNGTVFIDISDPVNPVYLGKLPTHTTPTTWRDVKVYNNYAFIVSEASNHGMQVFDLTRLRNVANPPETFTEDAHYDGFGNSHNIVINEDTGYAYSVGDNTYSGGPHFVDISNPLSPVAAGGYPGSGYTHDAQVITYNGPDSDYTGREIYVGSNASFVTIVDVTDKNNPQLIADISYTNDSYTHQGWFTEDLNYFILGDETDEINFGFNTKTIVFDFTDLDNPQLDFDYFGSTTAIDHNGYTKGNKYYLANYTAGMKVLDISDLQNQTISELGYFDTYPANDSASFNGAWNVYPYFESGNIVISNYSGGGFFLVKASGPTNEDNEDPIALCQSITILLDQNGQATINANFLDGGSTDNEGIVSFEVDIDTFSCDDIGENTVTLTISDASGNTATCEAIVSVLDTINPIFVCAEDQNALITNPDGTYTLPDYISSNEVSATDNCSDNLMITQNPSAGTIISNGITIVSFETADDSGNSTTCSFELNVILELGFNNNNLSEGLTLYPNPSASFITINSKNQPIENVNINDISGKQIIDFKNLNTETKNIDISNLSKGIYFISINNQVVKKLIKI
ncbi:choice-of-anchor B family protein [Flavobacteriaceae bacterium]|nr:choice-of-anchor B family protein [Flavobacteriaceae bacterium]